jgi:hypothetical protein
VGEIVAPIPLLPTPKAFVSGLDLECFATPGPALNRWVELSHLNPVLIAQGLPRHRVFLRELVQTCVPVRKNNVTPSQPALQFIRHVDLACYRVEAEPLSPQHSLLLRHLNPVLSNYPPHAVRLVKPEQLCVPVGKNGVQPPPAVLNLVRHIDLECYSTYAQYHPSFGVTVRQLNPQLTDVIPHGLPLTTGQRQMCVPVRKNQQQIPPNLLNIIRWVDLEKFTVAPFAYIPPRPLVLNHQNPLFVNYPPVRVLLQQSRALMVPVSKNGATPP